MRSKSIAGLVAVMLAVAAIGAGTTFAQTPVVPAPTVPAEPNDQSAAAQPTVEVPKPEKPTVRVPGLEKPTVQVPKPQKPTVQTPKLEKPTVQVPKPQKPTVQVPKPQKPTVQVPKPQKPTVQAPKPQKPTVGKQPDKKPTPDTSEPAQPNPETPKPAQPELAEPQSGEAGAPSAQPDRLGSKSRVDVARPVSPRSESAGSVPVSGVRPDTSTRGAAAEQGRQAGPAGPERSGTSSARSSGDPADAIPVAGGPAAVTRRRPPHLASDGVAGAAAAASLDPRQRRVLILSDPAGYNVVPLLLALVFAAGIGYVLGREFSHGPGLLGRRPAPTQRGARPRPLARGSKRIDRRFTERLLRTISSRPRARRRVPRHPFGRARAAVAPLLWPSVRR